MKNLFAAAFIAFTISTFSTSFAAATPGSGQEKTGIDVPVSITLSQLEKSKLDVVIENTSQAKLMIGLYDSSGNYIASKKITNPQPGTRLRFNVAALSDGAYQVKVMDGNNTQVKKFELKTIAPAPVYQNLTVL